MRAFVVDKYDKKGILRLAEMPDPELRDDDVLIQVHAAGVNILDSKIRAGEFKLILPFRLPLTNRSKVGSCIADVRAPATPTS